MKEYIHHPETIPLQVEKTDPIRCKKCHSEDANGMSFSSSENFKRGTVLKIKIIVEGQMFKAYGMVVKTKKLKDELNEIFIDFDEKIEPFKIKMIQQVCQVLDYSSRKGIKKELAASKWIGKHAEDFCLNEYNKD